MSWSYGLISGNPNPQVDYVRLLVADTDSTKPVFADEEILAAYNIIPIFVLTPTGGGQAKQSASYQPSYYRVAAILLDALAANKARLSALMKVLDVDLDISKASQELRATAKEYRDVEDNSGAFAIVEMLPNNWSAYERVWKQLLRLGQ